MKPEDRTPNGANRPPLLVAFINGTRVGVVWQTARGKLHLTYDNAWRTAERAYPLSLSLPLSAADHDHQATEAFLWGLLPDNSKTLDRYARLFGVSAGNPAALLAHIGVDCAGAVQFAPPDKTKELATPGGRHRVDWLTDDEVASELRTVRETGTPSYLVDSAGQFSLAGAQPKIALLQEGKRWGRPSGRMPSNRILKPPSGGFHGFVENEHFCLELAKSLDLGAASSQVRRFGSEIAIVVRRFDRVKRSRGYTRIHQEDVCQARGVLPTRKYQNEGGPGVRDVITLLREASLKAGDDIQRFLRVLALNWVIAATDAHAKNYALLHGPEGVRLAPFYDILSYLPYADIALHRVKLAMSIGGEYQVRRINRFRWEKLAKENGLSVRYVLDNVHAILSQLPVALQSVRHKTLSTGLDAAVIDGLADRIGDRTRECLTSMRAGARGGIL